MKYVVITSQYYHSRFSFVCEHNLETFRKQAVELIEELEKYKREPNNESPFNYGDCAEKYFSDTRSRCNVNDEGDIYFEICETISEVIRIHEYYKEQSRIQSVGYKRQQVTKDISIHHQRSVVAGIIQNHFKLL